MQQPNDVTPYFQPARTILACVIILYLIKMKIAIIMRRPHGHARRLVARFIGDHVTNHFIIILFSH